MRAENIFYFFPIVSNFQLRILRAYSQIVVFTLHAKINTAIFAAWDAIVQFHRYKQTHIQTASFAFTNVYFRLRFSLVNELIAYLRVKFCVL